MIRHASKKAIPTSVVRQAVNGLQVSKFREMLHDTLADAIRDAKSVCDDPAFTRWADCWLNRTSRHQEVCEDFYRAITEVLRDNPKDWGYKAAQAVVMAALWSFDGNGGNQFADCAQACKTACEESRKPLF